MSVAMPPWALAAAWLAAAALPGAPQQPQASPPADTRVFPTGVEQVTVDVVVLDRKGEPVPGLGKDDFTVLDEGRPQDIVSFEMVRPPAAASAAVLGRRPRVATNASLDELRRRKRRGIVGLTEDVDSAGPGAADLPLDLRIADRLAVDEALDALPAEFRVAVVLRDLLDLDYAEIAEVLGIPPGTVRSRIARGRAALARLLGNQPTPAERPSGQP